MHSLHPDLPELNGTELRLDWTHSAVISPLRLLTPDWDRSAWNLFCKMKRMHPKLVFSSCEKKTRRSFAMCLAAAFAWFAAVAWPKVSSYVWLRVNLSLLSLSLSFTHCVCGVCLSLSLYLLKSSKVLYDEAGRGFLGVLRTVLPLSYDDKQSSLANDWSENP